MSAFHTGAAQEVVRRWRRGRVRAPQGWSPNRRGLRAATRAARRANHQAKKNLLRYIRWMPPQYAFLSCDHDLKLLRTGNQTSGKTTAGLAEVHWKCACEHPYYKVRRGPIEAWVVCASWSQSVAIQKKYWELVPRHHLDPSTTFDSKNGFGAKSPMVKYTNGSVVRFKTANQETLDVAGATIDHVMFDEPPRSQGTFGEIWKRVQAREGSISLTMTPIGAPIDWLKKMVEDGIVKDLHFRLTPDVLVPVGAKRPIRLITGRVCDAEYIDEVIRKTLPHEVPVRVHGEWETRAEGQVFASFRATGEGSHVHQRWADVDFKICLGIDHGEGVNREFAVLCAVDDSGEFPRVVVLDEYGSEGPTTPEQDIRSILAMLERNGLEWRDLDYVYGDKPVDKMSGRKGNRDLENALVRELKLRDRAQLTPRIKSAKRGRFAGRGAVSMGCTFMHRCMVREGHWVVAPWCKRVIECLERWNGHPKDKFKDGCDATRYALTYWIRKSGHREVQFEIGVG